MSNKIPDDRYLLNASAAAAAQSSAAASIDCEELANACRRLGISGPLEPLLRELNQERVLPRTGGTGSGCGGGSGGGGENNNSKDRRHHSSACKSERKSNRNKQSIELSTPIDDRAGKSSTYGQESWGRDSGARDLSPEPHRVSADCQLVGDSDTGTTSMIHLANKVNM